MSIADIEAQLVGPGGVFELVSEQVLGQTIEVFKSREHSLREYVEKSKNHGSQEYIICDGQRISFAEHYELVVVVAARLAKDYGVKKGDRVAILAANHPQWIICFWATVSLGAICVGLNGWWTRKEILYGLNNCDPVLLVADEKRLARIKDDEFSCPSVCIDGNSASALFASPTVDEAGRGLPETLIEEDDPALILYTSGTTGTPKGAVLSHRGLINFIASAFFNGYRSMMLAQVNNTEHVISSCGLYTAPLFHLSGLFSGAISALAAGLKSVWTTQRFDPDKVLGLIETEKVGHWASLGSMASRLMDCPNFDSYNVSSLRIIGSGGAPTSEKAQQRIQKAFPNAQGNMALGYGLTESTGVGTTNMGAFLKENPDSVGRVFPGAKISIRDKHNQQLPVGTEGEICVRGACVMLEYWHNSEATAEAITPDRWLKTGDIGYFKGDYLYVNSRARDLILKNAENIYPIEIEQCLESHPLVSEAAVIGVEHKDMGQEVKAILVMVQVVADDKKNIAQDVLAAHCIENLATFKVPSIWEFRDFPLPRNAAGKIMKNVLSGQQKNTLLEE